MVTDIRDPLDNVTMVAKLFAGFVASGDLVLEPEVDNEAALRNYHRCREFAKGRGLPGANLEEDMDLVKIARLRSAAQILSAFTKDDVHRMKDYISVEGAKNNLQALCRAVELGMVEFKPLTSNEVYVENCRIANEFLSLPNPFTPPPAPTKPLLSVIKSTKF
jgi:hypothetical protein